MRHASRLIAEAGLALLGPRQPQDLPGPGPRMSHWPQAEPPDTTPPQTPEKEPRP